MGVKQLWTLLGPAGRHVLLETMEGKTMAIDSSIWIYQFQATMRDKDGRALVNAHVLGFLRRICKLLFYGIKPVFVFDGGAPVLKRMTLIERKRKKAGAAESHAKVAEKLLAAHMRREAVAHVQGKNAPKTSQHRPVIDESTVYLEDLVTNAPKATPTKETQKSPQKSPDSLKKKAKFRDHDPYRLPDVDPSTITRATSSLRPDPRLATEEELRAFIDSMRPEDFDVSSPAFRDLPTEVQYEIIGDLRLKSRQTSYKRLQSMLRSSRTPLDFSKAQIRNLQQRNALTQQLLETTDTISKAHVTIPVRIASERNKEYVLVKNEGEDGGWVLGIRDDGSQEKPIVIDDAGYKQQDSDGDDEMELEEVAISGGVTSDPDLPEHRGRMALASVAKRNSPKKPQARPLRTPGSKPEAKASRTPLFIPNNEEDDDVQVAIQRSMEQEEEDVLQRAITASLTDPAVAPSETSETAEKHNSSSVHDSDSDDLYVPVPSRLDTALSFANTSPSKQPLKTNINASGNSPMFGEPSLLLSEKPTASTSGSVEVTERISPEPEEDSMEEVISTGPTPTGGSISAAISPAQSSSDDMEEVVTISPSVKMARNVSANIGPAVIPQKMDNAPAIIDESLQDIYADDTLEDIYADFPTIDGFSKQPLNTLPPISTFNTVRDGTHEEHLPLELIVSGVAVDVSANATAANEEDPSSDWERLSLPGHSVEDVSTSRHGAEAEDWDAAQEMDAAAEEGDFVEFVSQMKGQDLDVARRDIEEEIRELNKQKKTAMRDSEDVTHQMISQIMLMLRLFGIPYITAPMEAEAQCAALVSLGLVDGVITDDSDVFLFGALRVYKNMFNQSKTIESFFLSDLARELGLDRDKLIRLAYLLGSDYVEGLPGIGPVVAMELLKEFPGEDGLHKFREWWKKVQSGKDTDSDNNTAFRRRFKKKFKKLYLPAEWPNAAVRDAYYHPAVDESEEPFKWGLPDLDALHHFFGEELGWHQAKVDDLLLPIIRKMGQRGRAAAANKQGVLDGYLDVTLGSGTFAPRKRQAYSSKRLQQVVTDFRKEQNKLKNGGTGSSSEASNAEDLPTRKRKAKDKTKEASKKGPAKRKPGSNISRKSKPTPRSSLETGPEVEEGTAEGVETPPPPALAAKLRPRPKPVFQDSAAGGDEEEGSNDSDEDFVVKRPRRKL